MKYISLIIGLFIVNLANAQDNDIVINKVVAVVGSNLILMSDVEAEYMQFLAQGNEPDADIKCSILEELLFQKLLVNQAQLDSIEVSESQVEQELDQRIRYFVAQIGSVQKLEEYYGKSITQIKNDFKTDVRKLLLARTMKGKITADIKVTPSDVRTYFNSIPVDSLPYINSEVEVAQITKTPPISDAEKKYVKEKLEKLRDRIMRGEDFATLAVLYSEDPGSAKNSGELGFVKRNELVPEFAAEAFTLKGKEVSRVVETQFGFHIIQLIERRGDEANVRHILLTPKTNSSDLIKAQQQIDSIRALIVSGKYTFAEAAAKFSDDKETKYNQGLMINPETGTTRFEMDELDPQLFFIIDKMPVNDVSEPVKLLGTDNKASYRIVQLKTRSTPHKANLKDDYQRVQQIALVQKQNKAVDDWIKKKVNTTYIRLDDDLTTCKFTHSWKANEKAERIK